MQHDTQSTATQPQEQGGNIIVHLVDNGEYFVRVPGGCLQWQDMVKEKLGDFHIIGSGWLNEDIGTDRVGFRIKLGNKQQPDTLFHVMD